MHPAVHGIVGARFGHGASSFSIASRAREAVTRRLSPLGVRFEALVPEAVGADGRVT